MADWTKLYCNQHKVTSDIFDWADEVEDFVIVHADCQLETLYEDQDGDFVAMKKDWLHGLGVL